MADKPAGRIRVWDLPTRLFHWTLVALVVVLVTTGKIGGEAMKWHFWAGYAVLTLVIYRIVWGFVGSTTARFADFVRGPMAGLHHLRETLGKEPSRDVGHNAVGGWMVVALLLALLVQVGSGLFASDTDMGLVAGPLSKLASDPWIDRLTRLHHFWINLLYLMAALHVLAALMYLVVKRQNLIAAMIHGTKPWPFRDRPALRFAPNRLAFTCLALSACVVYFVIRAGG